MNAEAMRQGALARLGRPYAVVLPHEPPSAADIVSAVRARGSDARDLRDAVHEAVHALRVGALDWDREVIHGFILKLTYAERVVEEVLARATEALACSMFGIEYSARGYTVLSVFEATRDGTPLDWETFVMAVHLAEDLADDMFQHIARMTLETKLSGQVNHESESL